MSDALRIVRKDVRCLRWLLALWFAVLAARVVLVMSLLAAAGDVMRAGAILQQLSSVIEMVELLLTGLIVARLVHEEPLVGLTAFWLTRPYGRRTLVHAKLLFAVVVLVGLPLLADLTTMALLGARAPALVRAGFSAAVAYVGGTLSLMVIATLTSSLGVFVLTVLGMVVGSSMLAAAMLSISLWTARPSGYAPPAVPDATSGLVALAVYLCAALSVVVYQYHHRRWRAATVLAVAGVAAAVVVPMFWPWSFARGEEIRPGAWAAGATAINDPSWGTEVSDVNRFGRGAPRRQVNGRVTLSGAPSQVTVQQIGVRGRLQFTDGTIVKSSQGAWIGSSFRIAPVQAALGDVRLLTAREVYEQGWTPMVTLTEEEFTRYRGSSGRFDADVYFELLQTREVGVLPLMRGAALDDGVSRVEIVDVQRRTGSRDVTIRQWRAQSPLSVERRSQERLYVLRHRARGEALMGGVDSLRQMRRRANSAMMFLAAPLGLSVSLDETGGGFSAGTTFLRFPGTGFGKAPPLPPAWFDEAELVVLETARAGVVMRQLVIEAFPIPAN